MKNIFKNIFILTLGLLVLQGCDSGTDSRFQVDPTAGWVEFRGTGSTTISLVTTQLELPLEINVPVYPNGLTVNYQLEAVQGDFSQIVSTGSSVFIPGENDFRAGSIVLDFFNLDQLTDVVAFDVVLTSASGGVGIGVDENSLTRYRVSTPCPIVLADGDTYTGVSGGDSGYTATLTDNGDGTFSFDTSFGPLFVDTVCGGCLGGTPSYPGPFTFSVDPATFDVTIISGGEPSGVGNPFDLAYTISGSGTYNSCDDIFELTVTENGIFVNPQTTSVTLTGN